VVCDGLKNQVADVFSGKGALTSLIDEKQIRPNEYDADCGKEPREALLDG